MYKITLKSIVFIAVCSASVAHAALSSHTSLFPIESYNQKVDQWIKPSNKNYQKSLLSNKLQKKHFKQYYQHVYGDKSPWDKGYVSKHLKSNIKRLQQDILGSYSNKNKPAIELGYSHNNRPYSQKWIDTIKSNIPLNQLNKVKYKAINRAIAIDNIQARALPTNEPHFYSEQIPGQGYPFDNLQVSAIWAGSPLYIIEESKDKAWSLILTPSYIAWVDSKKIARADNAFIKKYKQSAHNKLAAITKTKTAILDKNNQFLFYGYIGSTFPASKLLKDRLYIPSRNSNGRAVLIEAKVPSKNFTIMPYKLTPEHLATLIKSLINRPYGWGNFNFNNDCSSELKSLYTPFGIWLPRHSSAQVKIRKMHDLSDFNMDQRLQYLKQNGHPLMSLVYVGGHIVLYVGTVNNKIMSYQDVWALLREDKPGRYIIGKSVFLPLEKYYKNAPRAVSQSDLSYFQVMNLDS